jgi:hypothetical protein
MPEAANDENDEYIPDLIHHFTLTSSDRYIQIISEPSVQTDMPSAPKFSYVATEEWYGKIAHERETEQARTTNSDVAIPGEVAVDLDRKQNGPKNERTGI